MTIQTYPSPEAPDASYESAEEPSVPDTGQPKLPASAMPLLRLVGQVGSAFLVAEGPDGLYLVDQHAAHERVLFEKLMAQKSDQVPSQNLLDPVTVELPAESSRLLEDQLPLMKKLGFEIEPFGGLAHDKGSDDDVPVLLQVDFDLSRNFDLELPVVIGHARGEEQKEKNR